MDNIGSNRDFVPLWCSKELEDQLLENWVDPNLKTTSSQLHQTEKKTATCSLNLKEMLVRQAYLCPTLASKNPPA